MIYEIMRAAAGPYLRDVMDFYIANQDLFNPVVAVGGVIWILYSRRNDKNQQAPKRNWLGIEIKR